MKILSGQFFNSLLFRFSLIWFYLVILGITLSCRPSAQELDYLIINALVFSGENEDPIYTDVGIKEEQIVFVGNSEEKGLRAIQVLDAKGLILAPGFIDPHTHLDRDLSDPEYRSNLACLMQGVTTVFAGNDGNSPLPIGRKLEEWERNGIGTNAGLFVGHGAVRRGRICICKWRVGFGRW
jgi:N-acyl-D-amino-acid deacylase